MRSCHSFPHLTQELTPLPRPECAKLAEELGLRLFHTSVRADRNVASIFLSLAAAHQARTRDTLEVEQVASSTTTMVI